MASALYTVPLASTPPVSTPRSGSGPAGGRPRSAIVNFSRGSASDEVGSWKSSFAEGAAASYGRSLGRSLGRTPEGGASLHALHSGSLQHPSLQPRPAAPPPRRQQSIPKSASFVRQEGFAARADSPLSTPPASPQPRSLNGAGLLSRQFSTDGAASPLCGFAFDVPHQLAGSCDAPAATAGADPLAAEISRLEHSLRLTGPAQPLRPRPVTINPAELLEQLQVGAGAGRGEPRHGAGWITAPACSGRGSAPASQLAGGYCAPGSRLAGLKPRQPTALAGALGRRLPPPLPAALPPVHLPARPSAAWNRAQSQYDVFRESDVVRAFNIAHAAHEGRYRESGDPALLHCLEVARSLAVRGRAGWACGRGLWAGIAGSREAWDEAGAARTLKRAAGPPCLKLPRTAASGSIWAAAAIVEASGGGGSAWRQRLLRLRAVAEPGRGLVHGGGGAAARRAGRLPAARGPAAAHAGQPRGVWPGQAGAAARWRGGPAGSMCWLGGRV